MVDYKKIFGIGSIVGLALPVFLKTVSNLVSMIPGVSLNLNAVVAQKTADVLTISTNGLTTAVNTGLGAKVGEFASKILAISPIPITGLEWIYTAIGGGLMFVGGAYIADKLHLMKGGKVQQVATAGAIGAAATGALLSWSLSIPTIPVIISTVITWLILSWIIVKADEKLKLGLV